MVWSNDIQRDVKIPDYYNDITLWSLSREDSVLMFGTAVMLTIARHTLQNLFKKRAKSLGMDEKEQRKYSESCWKLVYYVPMWLWGLYLVYDTGIFPQTINCWDSMENAPNLHPILNLFYMVQLGFYVHSLFAHFVFESKRSDFWALLFHHIATIWLIYFSHIIRVQKIGLLILIAHDANDIPLELGKTLVYTKSKWVHVCFVVLISSWAFTRLYIYPAYAIYSVFFEAKLSAPEDVFPFYSAFKGFLCFLQVLHVYWFGLMVRMAYRVVVGLEKEVVDSREDHERKKEK